MGDHYRGYRKDSIVSGASPSFSGISAEQGVCYPQTSCYDYRYPGHNGTYSDGCGHMNSSGGAYRDDNKGSVLYYMPSYSPYANGTLMGMDGQQPYFSSSLSATGSNGMKIYNDFKTTNYPLDMKLRQQSASSVLKSGFQAHQRRSLNELDFGYQNRGLFSKYDTSYASGGRLWNDIDRYKLREKYHANRESEELTRGPRVQSVSMHLEDEKTGLSLARDKYNLEGFQTKYNHAKFYVIKSYSEDDVHKCIKYDVWSSTPNGNKKLDAAFREAEGKINIFLFFSVNGSGQFVGVAEMIGPVDYEKNMDFWQLDKWNGVFPVKWHIVKDVPNTLLRHIILENNDHKPVTYTRDTQEVGLKQGLEMLEIFKSYSAKTSLLDDINFYENREKMIKAKRVSKTASQPEEYQSIGERVTGEGSMSINSLKDPTSSLIKLTRNLSLSSNTLNAKTGDKSVSYKLSMV